MRVDIDTYREIIDTLTRNKSRSLLTGFGVFWGVFMLIGLIGGGSGLKEKLSPTQHSSSPSPPRSPIMDLERAGSGVPSWVTSND